MSKQTQAKAENFIDNAGRLQAESETLHKSVASTVDKLNGIRNGISQLNSTIARLRNRAAGSDINLDQDIRKYEEQREVMKADEQQVAQELRSMNARLVEIPLEMQAVGPGLSRKDVLAFLDMVRETEERMNRLRAAIDEQRTIQDEASEFANPLPDLEEQREDLLAAHAIGEATQKELDDINASISMEEQRMATVFAEAEDKIAGAKKTSMGLNRQLEEATEKHNDLLARRPQVIAACLRTEGAVVGREYFEAAGVLIEKFKQLVGLDALCKQLEPENRDNPVIFSGDWRVMHLPALKPENGITEAGEKPPTTLFATSPAATAEKLKVDAASGIQQELADAGIQI